MASSTYTLWLPEEQSQLYSKALALAILVAQSFLDMHDGDGRRIESPVAMARRIEELEQRLRGIDQLPLDQGT